MPRHVANTGVNIKAIKVEELDIVNILNVRRNMEVASPFILKGGNGFIKKLLLKHFARL